jgi:hypothetical protein
MWGETWSLAVREDYRMRASEYEKTRTIFGSDRQGITGI